MMSVEEAINQIREMKFATNKDLGTRIKDFVSKNVDIESLIEPILDFRNRDNDDANCFLLYTLGLGFLNYYREFDSRGDYILDRDKLRIFMEGIKFNKRRDKDG